MTFFNVPKRRVVVNRGELVYNKKVILYIAPTTRPDVSHTDTIRGEVTGRRLA